MTRHHRHARGANPDGPGVRGYVYIIVNDLIGDRVKVGYTMADPLERAHAFSRETGATGTFVVLYEARVDAPRRVEQAAHRHLADFRLNGEWFQIDADTAVNAIRSAAAGVVHHENTTARWHPSQPAPSENTKARLAVERAKAAEKRRREAAEQSRREAEARRSQEAAEEARRRDAEARARTNAERAKADADRRQKRREQMAAAIPIGIVALLACGVLYAATLPSLPPSAAHLDDLRREVARLETVAEQERVELEVAERSLRDAESKVQSLPKELSALKLAIETRQEAVDAANQQVARAEKQQAEFKRRWPNFKAVAQAQAEQDEKKFIDARIGEFFADEDRVAESAGRRMSQQGIDNNVARIRREIEPEAIAVFNESAKRTMRKLESMRAELAAASKSSREELAAAQGRLASDSERMQAIPGELDRNRRLVSELHATVANLEKSLRLVEVAAAEARASLVGAERAAGTPWGGTPPSANPRYIEVKQGRKT
jgi:hypothetical protein